MGEYLEAGIVPAAVCIGEAEHARCGHDLGQISGQKALSRPPGVQYQGVICDAGLLIAEDHVDQRLGLLAHKRFVRNIIEVKDAKIGNTLGAFQQALVLLPEIVFNVHGHA